MLKCKKTTLALLVTLAMTVVVTVLRVTLVPRLQSMNTGVFNLSYIVVAGMLLTIIALFVLLRLGKDEMPDIPTVRGKWLLPIAVTVIAVGACILLTTVVDMYVWAAYGTTPPPQKAATGTIDRITLFLSLILGVLSGIYFMRLGAAWVREDREYRGMFPLWALAPAFWIWMRLARYEVSYSSAVEVHESFYDFAMLLMSLLFLFTLARQLSDTNPKKPFVTAFLALCTAFMSISGSVSRVILFLLGQGDAYRAGQLAGISDFAVGVLAIVLALYWLRSDEPEEVFDVDDESDDAEAESAEDTVEETEKEAEEDILEPQEPPSEE